MSGERNLQEQLKTLFVDEFHVRVMSPETDLLETGLLDSLKLVELLSHLENQYGIRISIDDLELEQFRSIANIAKFLDAQVAFSADESDQRLAKKIVDS